MKARQPEVLGLHGLFLLSLAVSVSRGEVVSQVKWLRKVPRCSMDLLVFVCILMVAWRACAADIQTLGVVEVTDSAENVAGAADSASEGAIPRKAVEAEVAYAPGQVLEDVPGLSVTQHSGEGKANQYFLRGVNLDHGTDLRVTVDGMLVNERSHAHGQGYADLNFLIPELIGSIGYRKGPYYADEGDFSTVGAIHVGYVDTLERGIAKVTVGQDGYERALLADSSKLGMGTLLYGLEYVHNNGPWTIPRKLPKIQQRLPLQRDRRAKQLQCDRNGLWE